jgi:hypothetical protein
MPVKTPIVKSSIGTSTRRKRSARIAKARHILPIGMSHSSLMRTIVYHSRRIGCKYYIDVPRRKFSTWEYRSPVTLGIPWGARVSSQSTKTYRRALLLLLALQRAHDRGRDKVSMSYLQKLYCHRTPYSSLE